MSVSDMNVGGTGWVAADIWEAIAATLPAAPALVHGRQVVSWGEFDRHADGLARLLLDAGVAHQDKVALYLYNCPEYLETTFAVLKAGLVPVNTNYRYGTDELVYLWDNADAVAVVFHGTFTATIDALRHRVPGVGLWLWVDDGEGPCPPWAVDYATARATPTEGSVQGPWGRSPDDLLLLYTGGTTGLPKGVMWRQDDFLGAMNASATRRYGVHATLDDIAAALDGPGVGHVCACPLMHGTGANTSMSTLMQGGSVITLPGRHYAAPELLDAIHDNRAKTAAIVGDVFARPMVEALDAEPERWDITSLLFIVSSGVMWSDELKQGLLRHHPGLMIVDTFGSSEAMAIGRSVKRDGDTIGTGRFRPARTTRVITEDGRSVVPGSGEIGLVHAGGRIPLGYYKDPDKTAATFRVVDGARYAVPGDWASLEADGSMTLLGRGSQCINTGGEKVFPEEVEEALKTDASVLDAAVVGVPDPRFGEAICALVEIVSGATFDEAALIAHVKGRLAGYKAPKRVFALDTMGRSAAGKLDYKALKARAVALSA
jgi:acyl-CoA synthetase (AMP-forming)/AMP-acid ligase II